MKQTVKLNESQLRKVVAESVKKVLKEYHPNTKKDPMKQWFKDMDDAQKVRDTMDYITKGGKNPNKKSLKESEEDFDYPSSMQKIRDSINLLADVVSSLNQSGNKYCEPFQKIKVELIELANQFKNEYDKPYEAPIEPDSYLNGDFAF